jgi:hypothetical protein
MHMLRSSGIAFALLALSALTASAQGQLQTGSALFFDHPVADALDTEKYQLCVDAVADASCVDLAVLKVGTVNGVDTFSFTLPATVSRGNHTLQVRAVGFGEFGASVGSNALAARIIGKPGPPVLLRLQQAVTP